jgi:hypothetical protein
MKNVNYKIVIVFSCSNTHKHTHARNITPTFADHRKLTHRMVVVHRSLIKFTVLTLGKKPLLLTA